MDKEINYFSIDGKNEIKFISNENKSKYLTTIYTTLAAMEEDYIGTEINSYFNKLIPKNGSDKIKINVEISKIYFEKYKLELNNIYDSINRILTFNSNDSFTFNKKNSTDLTNALVYIFNHQINKYKIKNYSDLKKKINKITTEQIDVTKLFLDKQNLTKSFVSTNSPEKKSYFDSETLININNIYETFSNKSTTTSNFSLYKYPNYSLKGKQEYNIPIEIIIIINKLSSIKKLIFPIFHSDEKKKLQILLILLNKEWIFPNVEDILIDFNDSELQKGLNQIYENQLYMLRKKIRFKTTNYDFKRKNKLTWNAFGDISLINDYYNYLMTKTNVANNVSNLEIESINDMSISGNPFSYNEPSDQFNLNYLNAIYKEKNININEDYESYSDEEDILNEAMIMNKQKSEKKTIIKNLFPFFGSSKNNKKEENGEFEMIEKFVKLNSNPFEIIIIYSYFISELNLKTLSLIFNDHYSKEIETFLKNLQCYIMNFHFLLFLNKIDSLEELNIEFNSLDGKTFEKLISLINKNFNLQKLRISFFVSDINYSPYSLIKLCTGLQMNYLGLFQEQKKIISEEIAKNFDNTDIDLFLINRKLYDSFESNLSKLFFILDTKINLKELVLIFDTPFIISINDKYINLILKYIINILLMVTSGQNKIEVLKIISPSLPFDSRLFPLLNELLELSYCRDNEFLQQLTIQFKIYQCINLSYIIPYNLKILFLGDLDKISFEYLIDYYKSNEFLNHSELISIKISLNLSIILLDDVLQSSIDYLQYSPKDLKEKVLLSNLKTKNTNVMKQFLNALYFKTYNVDNIFISFSRSAETKYLNANSEICSENKTCLETMIQVIKNKFKIKDKKKIIEIIKDFLIIPKKNKRIFCGRK